MLSQVQNGKEVVISYFSRQLQKSETNYPTIEKEALAVVEAIRHFKYYLLDRPFTVLSDHAPLQWLKTFKDTNGRLGRWAVELGSLNCVIRYKPGRIHQNADCLSRIKIAHVSCVTLSLYYMYSIHHVVASAVRRSIRRTPGGRTVSSTAQEL